MAKFDWHVIERAEYTLDTTHGSLVSLGHKNYLGLAMSGIPDPTSQQFQDGATALYQLGEYLAAAPAHQIQIPGYRPYVHYPLELNRHSADQKFFMLMKTPNAMTEAAFEQARDQLGSALPASVVSGLEFLHFSEGLEAQIGAIGMPDAHTQQALAAFIADSGYHAVDDSGWHRELILDDIRDVPMAQWHTILRQSVADNPGERSQHMIIENP